MGETETKIYVTLLLIGALVGEEDANFQNLIVEGRERLRKPWESKPIDSAAVRTSLGENAAALEMLTLSDQISPILAAGTKGNPRQVKRFLNAILLRKSIAEARGFGDEVKLSILAKLMLAERFRPTLFNQIATSASSAVDGICQEMSVLENSMNQGKLTDPKNILVSSWLSTEYIKQWAKLEPSLKGVDLRPYLFVSKDRKDYFGTGSVSSKLGELIERLKGKKLAVKSASRDITALSGPDANMVFDELRLTILGNDSYSTRPVGIEGIISLVEIHPHLESRLLDLLEEMPAKKIGVWAAGGWEGPIRDTQNRSRLSGILQQWEQSGSVSLKAALKVSGGA